VQVQCPNCMGHGFVDVYSCSMCLGRCVVDNEATCVCRRPAIVWVAGVLVCGDTKCKKWVEHLQFNDNGVIPGGWHEGLSD
jgi:hypothetical protein